jgi:hypothetical protein
VSVPSWTSTRLDWTARSIARPSFCGIPDSGWASGGLDCR